ncbi:hypothetical protein FO519_003718 [Halicephalobus sp. NKZ332]|nr:hypothetical protein FO519_003718 [Halicephalobus sp. NKZ332]
MNKEKLFQEKISILNVEFVDFIRSAVKENPAYDLSPPLRDYLEHVKELDKMYADRPVLVAKRKIKDGPKAEKPKSISTKKEEPKKLPGGLVEPPGQFNFAPKVQMPEIPKLKDSTPTLSFSAPTSNSTPLAQNRKRRPDQALDYDEMKSTRSSDYGKDDKRVEEPPKPLGQFLFGSSKPKETSIPTFNFGESKSNSTPEAKNGNSGDKGNSLFAGLTKPTGQFLFNSSNQKGSSELNSTPTQESKNNTSNDAAKGGSLFAGLTKPTGQFLFNPSNTAKDTPTLTSSGPKSTSPLFSQGSKNTESNGKSSLFGGLAKPAEDGKPSLFGGLSKPAEDGKVGLFGGLSKASEDGKPNLFGGLVKVPEDGKISLFGGISKPSGFFAPKQSENNGEEQDKDEQEEPPKFDAVQHDEPDAVFTTKCSLHNFTEGQYKKAGTGFIYIKKSEKGPQLLIRAATTLGNVLVNTYINDGFKAEKKDKDRIQFSYPAVDGMKTHLAKVVDMQGTLDYFTGAKKP